MSDWVNWQDYAEMQKPEVQRQGDEAESLMRTQKAQMDASLSNLSSEANRRAKEGNFKGVEALGGYGEVMRQRDSSQAASPRIPGALERPAWEQDLTKGQTAYANPWAQLGARLSAGTNKFAKVSNDVSQKNAAAAQAAEQKRFNEDQRAKNDKAINGKKDKETADYVKWSNAVNNAANSNLGPGTGAWYDAQNGGVQPSSTAPSTPRTKRTQGYAYNASPTNTDSNFGMNYGYSSGNDWNF